MDDLAVLEADLVTNQMTIVNVHPTKNDSKYIFEGFCLKFNDLLGAEFWAGRALTKVISGWWPCSPPIRSNRPLPIALSHPL